MKRGLALSLALALALSLLTGCEYFVPDSILEEAEKNRPSFLPRGSDPPGSEGPSENAAGGVDEYGFTVFPEGNYLADPKFDTDEFLPDYDADPSFAHGYSTNHYALCRTDDTIYTLHNEYSNSGDAFSCLMMYTDKATGISGPLCGKPECLHRDENCNAYVFRHLSPGFGLSIYEGKLYWVNGMAEITRMNPDGTSRETVCRIHGDPLKNTNNYRMLLFHRGYLYLAGLNQTIINGKEGSIVSVRAYSLESGEGFTVWEKTVDDYAQRCLIKFVGNELYIMPTYFNYEDRENHSGSYSIMELYRWDSRTRQGELLYSETSTPGGPHFEGRSFMPVPGDGIYFHAVGKAIDGGGFSVQYVCKYSFASGEVETVLAFNDKEDQPLGEGLDKPYFTWDHIVADYTERLEDGSYDRVLYLFDHDGNLVLTRHLGKYGIGEFMGADDEYIYFLSMLAQWGDPDENGDRVIHHQDDFVAVPLDDREIIVIPVYDKTEIISRG